MYLKFNFNQRNSKRKEKMKKIYRICLARKKYQNMTLNTDESFTAKRACRQNSAFPARGSMTPPQGSIKHIINFVLSATAENRTHIIYNKSVALPKTARFGNKPWYYPSTINNICQHRFIHYCTACTILFYNAQQKKNV